MSLFPPKPEVEEIGEGRGEGEQKRCPASLREDSVSKVDHDKPTTKTSDHQPYLDVPLQSTFARSSDTLSDLSTYSADNENERRTGRLLTVHSSEQLLLRSPVPLPKTWEETVRLFWARNKGLALVILAQLFGVMMNVTIRLLERSGDSGPGMHPFQVRPQPQSFDFLRTCSDLSLILIDSVRSNEWYPCPQRYLSVVGQGRRSAFWIAGSPWTFDRTWIWWILWR